MNLYFKLFFSLVFFAISTQSFAVQIVRIQMDYDATLHPVDLELFDDLAGPSVTNFLNYVNDDGINGFRFNDTFFTRSVPGFIIQTGSFTFRPQDPANDILSAVGEPGSSLEVVPADATVDNDFNLSNLRGTIAYAKLSDDPNSATSGWFINLADNSENLDNQNEGFTVFGSIIDDGMVVADEIATFPIHPFASAIGIDFADLPVVNFDLINFPGVLRSNLVMLPSFTIITRPIVRLTPSNIDLQLDVISDGNATTTITTLKNTGNESLLINAIANLSAPFNVVNDNCSNTTLLTQAVDSNSICTIEVEFSATTLGDFNDALIITYTDILATDNYSVSTSVSGEGVPVNAVSSISTTNISYSDTIVNSSTDEIVTIRNKGGTTLIISAINRTGADSTQFTVDNAGCIVGSMLAINETCDITISFSPTSTGTKNAILEVLTNSNTSTVTLTGEGTQPTLTVGTSFDFTTSINLTASDSLAPTNSGTGNLIISDISITGPDAALFAQLNNCPNTNNVGGNTPSLGAGETCVLVVEFTPFDAGAKSAILTISSNDPVNPTTIIDLTGDTDGSSTSPILSVPPTLEIAGSVNETASQVITPTNSGTGNIIFSDITIDGPDAVFFSEVNNCPGTNNSGGAHFSVGPTGSCAITVTFIPLDATFRTATLTITSNDSVNPVSVIELTGRTGEPSISTDSTFNVGTSQINGNSAFKLLTVNNTGVAPLEIFTITGLNGTDFLEQNNCIGTGLGIPSNSSCTVLITLQTTTPGQSAATLTITSNDPVNPVINIAISGFADNDSDGILSSIELASPNAGDNNNDGITDDIQNNVASLVAKNSNYITFISENSTTLNTETAFVDILLLDGIPDGKPEETSFDLGLYSFSITLPAGDGVRVALMLPSDTNTTTFFKYGATAGNPSPHWYEFSFDAETGTGAQFTGKVTIKSPTGTEIEKKLFIITYRDGERGDDDLLVNGIILNNVSGPSIDNKSSSSGSGALFYILFYCLFIAVIRNIKYKNNPKILLSL